jgi:acyl-CoA thioester hydrolase
MPITYRGTVFPWHCDHMGHMNVMHYVGKFDEATWQLFRELGIGPTALRASRRGMAAVEQNLTYLAELHPGDVITVNSGVLEAKEKSIRFVHEMSNDETGKLAARAILVVVHLDLETRRACAFPTGFAERARQLLVPEPGPRA